MSDAMAEGRQKTCCDWPLAVYLVACPQANRYVNLHAFIMGNAYLYGLQSMSIKTNSVVGWVA